MAGFDNIKGQGFHTHPERRNTAGKPKGTRNRSTIVRELLEAIVEGSSGQTVVDAMTAAVIAKALNGDVQAWDKLMDSGYGKVIEKTENTVTLGLGGILDELDGRTADLPDKS